MEQQANDGSAGGSSFLTSEGGATGGTPQGGANGAAAAAIEAVQGMHASETQRVSEADQAIQDAMGAPPEWAPEKYWDKERKAVNVEELGKGYKNLEKLLGSHDRIMLPKSDPNEDRETWQKEVFSKLAPETPDAYEFKEPELPQGMSYDSDLEKSFRQTAHANGIHPVQAQALYDQFVKTQVERHAQYEKMRQDHRAELESALMREYGNKYEGAVKSAKKTMQTYADDDFRQYLDETGLGNDPRMVRFLMRVGKEMSGETKLVGRPEQSATPVDIDRAISEFRNKHSKALYDRSHPDNARLTQELFSLTQKRFEQQMG